jgi:hypothetical protein
VRPKWDVFAHGDRLSDRRRDTAGRNTITGIAGVFAAAVWAVWIVSVYLHITKADVIREQRRVASVKFRVLILGIINRLGFRFS